MYNNEQRDYAKCSDFLRKYRIKERTFYTSSLGRLNNKFIIFKVFFYLYL